MIYIYIVRTCQGVTPATISQSELYSGTMYLGTAPVSITPVVAETWAFLGRMMVSPGEQVAMIDA